MIWLWDNAVTIANVVMAAAAIAALIYAHLQINEGKRAERRANAHELWNETLHLAFDNPKLSDPTLKLAEFDYEARTIDGSIETFPEIRALCRHDPQCERSDPRRIADQGMGHCRPLPIEPAPRLSPVAILPEFGLSRAIHAAISGVPEGCAGQPLQGSAAAELARIDSPEKRVKKRA